jgi:single-strand DNA-binding protein
MNKVILMGNLTRNPQLRSLPSGTAVCGFGLAVHRKYRGQDGEMKEETCFVDVDAFGKQAETIGKYMSKGRPILVEGRLRFQQWLAEDGQKRSKMGVVLERFHFIGPRDGGGGEVPVRNDEAAPPPADDDIPF